MTRQGFGRGLAALMLAALGMAHPLGRAGPPSNEAPLRARVEAAFLRNFARYVLWPPSAFVSPQSPWAVCVLGGDRFGDVLERTLEGRTEQGRTFTVARAASLDQLPRCHIVYIDVDDPARRRAALAALRSRPVLTVGHTPAFLDEGGIIRLTSGERVAMSINLDSGRAASLTIQVKMLEVAQDYIENGVHRSWR